MSRLTLGLAALSALFPVLPAAANDPESASETTGVDPARAGFTDIKIGFDSAYKVGHWTPIAVTLEAGAEGMQGYLELQTLDGDEAPAMIRGPQVRLSAGTRQNLSMLAKPGRPQRRSRSEWWTTRARRYTNKRSPTWTSRKRCWPRKA